MKPIFILLMMLHCTVDMWSQVKFPYDSASHTSVYTQSFRLNPKVKAEDVYEAALSWLSDSARFTHFNAEPPVDTIKAKKNKRKAEAEAQFANPRPLQIQEPATNRALGMGIIRYYGSMTGPIKLLYIKYDIGVRIRDGQATITVSNIHYFHYHPVSYKQVPLYNFSGGRPCEEVGTLESLIQCESFRDEFANLATYCNKQIHGHIDHFLSMLKQKKYLYESKSATAAAAKPVPKAQTKPGTTKSAQTKK